MKRLILPIIAVLAVAAAVLVVVYYRPGSQAERTPQVARDFDANGNGAQTDRVSVEPARRAPQAEDEGSTERQRPAGTSAESQQRTSPQTDTSRQSAPTSDAARTPRPGFGGPGPGDGEGTQDRPAMRPGRFLERMDTDGDGKISKAEWKKNYDEAFAQADKNSDGYIDSSEMSGFRPSGGMGPGGRRSGQGPGSGGPPGGNE